jgi:hypothetical protein
MGKLNNKSIIYEALAMRDETREQIRLNAMILPKKKKHGFKFSKLLVAISLIFILTLGTGAYYVAKVFYIPGVGLTSDVNIRYEGIENPIAIKTEYGTLTLEFISKVTRNGKTNLSLYIDTKDIPAKDENDYPVLLNISVNGENIVSDAYIGGGGTWGIGDDGIIRGNHVYYWYSHENFPDINEFDLTLCGVETRIVLTEQQGNFAMSKENNGVTLVGYKFNGVNMMCLDVLNKNVNSGDYKYYGWNDLKSKDGIYHLLNTFPADDEITDFKTDVITMCYYKDRDYADIIEIPVPKDGDTIVTDIKTLVGEYVYKISEVRREGDIIYYTDNSIPRETTLFDLEKGQWRGTTLIPQGEELEKAIKNKKMFIDDASLYPEDWESGPYVNSTAGAIWNFDENAEIIRLKLMDITIRQYGDFDIKFDD